MQGKLTTTILIPAHNEEKSIEKTIKSCLYQTVKVDEIVVVNDGSTDNTAKILESFKDQIKIVTLFPNTGNKSLAQKEGLKYVQGDIFITTDADTILHPRFIEKIIPHFENEKVAAVAGFVRSIKNNWITASREIDYVIGQAVYKTAQDFIGYLLVIPGCAAAFRRKTFVENVVFSHDTITEDLDFTYQLHRKKFRIDFEKEAIVYTQDPPNISSYVRQMSRWYGGGWQNLLKHGPVAFEKPGAALELSLTYIEGLVASVMFILIPLTNFSIFLERLLPFYALIIFLFATYASLKDKRVDLLLNFPGYLIITFLNAYIFIAEFFKEIIFRKHTLVWLKADRTNA